MKLTRDYKESIIERAKKDPEFALATLIEVLNEDNLPAGPFKGQSGDEKYKQYWYSGFSLRHDFTNKDIEKIQNFLKDRWKGKFKAKVYYTGTDPTILNPEQCEWYWLYGDGGLYEGKKYSIFKKAITKPTRKELYKELR